MTSSTLLLVVSVFLAVVSKGTHGFYNAWLRGLSKKSKLAIKADEVGKPSWVENVSKLLGNGLASKESFGSSPTSYVDVAIIGGGISGLACGKTLSSSCKFLVCESESSAGGRVKSITQDGYIFDVGFQVFIDQYPDVKELFDYDALELKPFLPGAIVRYNNAFHVVSDPFRRPQDIFLSLISPIGSFVDKIKVGLLAINARKTSLRDTLATPEIQTYDYLEGNLGLSDSMIDRFFAPFYQMFTEGSACLPAKGMQAVPEQLAASLPPGSLRLNTRVERIRLLPNNKGYQLVLRERKTNKRSLLEAKQLVVACDPPNTKKLIEEMDGVRTGYKLEIPEGRGCMCVYFGFSGSPPIRSPILVLNGENRITSLNAAATVGINNVVFPSLLSPHYAPPGKHLASVTLVGCAGQDVLNDEELIALVKGELMDWWGADVGQWEPLKVFRIPYAQPAQFPATSSPALPLLPSGLYVAGDFLSSPTLQGAVRRGREVGEEILKNL
eukprot:gene36206-43917_t